MIEYKIGDIIKIIKNNLYYQDFKIGTKCKIISELTVMNMPVNPLDYKSDYENVKFYYVENLQNGIKAHASIFEIMSTNFKYINFKYLNDR